MINIEFVYLKFSFLYSIPGMNREFNRIEYFVYLLPPSPRPNDRQIKYIVIPPIGPFCVIRNNDRSIIGIRIEFRVNNLEKAWETLISLHNVIVWIYAGRVVQVIVHLCFLE